MKSFRPFLFFLIFFFLIGLSVSWFVFQKALKQENQLSQKKFEEKVQGFLYAIQERYSRNQLVLEGIRGFFAASNYVSSEEWNLYIEGLNLKEKFPGIRWVSVIQYIPSFEEDSFLSSFRQKENSSYQIWPKSTEGHLFPITYIYPHYFNPWLGFNLASKPEQKTKLQNSIRSKEIEVSKAFSLHSLEKSPSSFFFFLPIFKGKESIFGWAGAFIDFSILLEGVVEGTSLKEINLQVFSGKEEIAKNLIFQKINRKISPSWKTTKDLKLGDLYWTLSFSSFKTSETKSLYPFLILSFTLIFTVVLVFLFYFIVKKTASYQNLDNNEKDLFLKTHLQDHLKQALFATDTQGLFILFNSTAEGLLGYRAEDLIGKEKLTLLCDLEELKKKAEELSSILKRKIEPGFAVFQAFLEKEIAPYQEFSLLKKNRSKISLSLHLSVILDPAKNLIGYLFLVLEKNPPSSTPPPSSGQNQK